MKKNRSKYLLFVYMFIFLTVFFAIDSNISNNWLLWNKINFDSVNSSMEIHQSALRKNGVIICSANNDQGNPQICSDQAGGAFIVWEDPRNGDYDIYAQRVDSLGFPQWTSNGVVICTAPYEQKNPQICSDGFGGAIITWVDNRSSGPLNWDIYAQRINSNGVVNWSTNGIAICNVSNQQHSPAICSDGIGGAIITWCDRRTGSNDDIYAQRVNSAGVTQWIKNGTVICNASDWQRYPKLITHTPGGAIITWSDERYGMLNRDIYAQRVDSDGITYWGYGDKNGTVVCNASSYQSGPKICSDETLGAIILWTDDRNGNQDVYAQRIDAIGVTQWTANGTVICNDIYNQQDPQLCIDGAGGAIITWEDRRNSHWDIFVQKINSSGVVQWTANGSPIVTLSDDQEDPQLVSDGAGGAIIVWEDRTIDQNIFAQKIDSNGISQWKVNGIAICTAIDSQYTYPICSDGAGGAIIPWTDRRNGIDYDIYVHTTKNLFTLNQFNPLLLVLASTSRIDVLLPTIIIISGLGVAVITIVLYKRKK